MKAKEKVYCPIYFFGIGSYSDEQLQELSDEEFDSLYRKFELYYDRVLSYSNNFDEFKIKDKSRREFIKENIDITTNVMINQSFQFINESFRRLSVQYGWKKRVNQY